MSISSFDKINFVICFKMKLNLVTENIKESRKKRYNGSEKRNRKIDKINRR